jgi:hypothetical protein
MRVIISSFVVQGWMRALVIALCLVVAPTAFAEGVCEPSTISLRQAESATVWVEVEERDCSDARSFDIVIQDPDGRTHVEWFDDERGTGVAAYRSPRFVYWADEPRGCTVAMSVFGAVERACPAGPPPSPTLLA